MKLTRPASRTALGALTLLTLALATGCSSEEAPAETSSPSAQQSQTESADPSDGGSEDSEKSDDAAVDPDASTDNDDPGHFDEGESTTKGSADPDDNPDLESGDEGISHGYGTTLVRIVDGDTLAVKPVEGLGDDKDDEVLVDLVGITAPTGDQCGADLAVDNLAQSLPEGADLQIIPDQKLGETSPEGNYLGYVYAGTEDLSASQVSTGAAWASLGKDDVQPENFLEYSNMSMRATQAGLGSWGSCEDFGD